MNTYAAAVLLPTFHKPMKYAGMLVSAVSMFGYYCHLYRFSKKYIGKEAVWYIIAILMTSFLVVFSASGKFSQLWPNMLAQTCNNISYIGFIVANTKLYKEIFKQKYATEQEIAQ